MFSAKYIEFLQACVVGDISTVKRTLLEVSPDQHNSLALWHAVSKGNMELVDILLPLSNVKDQGGVIVSLAAKSGKLEILLKMIEYTDNQTIMEVLNWAVYRDKQDIICALINIKKFRNG